MKLSIVTTLYRSENFIDELHSRLVKEVMKITEDYELIMVNDGSPDRSLEVALALHAKDEKVKVIDLSRNFGHHKAMMTGLCHAGGDLVFLIDSDLEESPEVLGEFYNELNRSGADVVYGVRKAGSRNFFDEVAARIYHGVMGFLSDRPIPKNVSTVRLMRKRYVAALTEHRDREMVMAALWSETGFAQKPLMIERRHKGHSAYNLVLKLDLFVNAVTSFSHRPPILMLLCGFILVVVSAVRGTGIIFLAGLVVLCSGFNVLYLTKILRETKRRPYTVIRQIYDRTVQDNRKPL